MPRKNAETQRGKMILKILNLVPFCLSTFLPTGMAGSLKKGKTV